MTLRNAILSLVLLLTVNFLKAQPIQLKQYLAAHTVNRVLPSDLQVTRSAVILYMPDNGTRDKVLIDVHSYLRRMSIDATLYFDVQDLYAGTDATAGFLKQINQRQVKNVIFLLYNQQANVYELSITPFNGTLDIPQGTPSAWGVQNSEIKEVFRLLGNDIIRAELDNTNFLIPETPYLSQDAAIFKGQKFSVHCRDLKARKIAVMKFKKIENNNPGIASEIDVYNKQVDVWNKDLEQVLRTYPFEYEFVDNLDEKEMYRQGFQYALFLFQTSGINIKKLFNLELISGETEYVSQNARSRSDIDIKRISVDEVVYKFYVKHLVTGDIYIGDKWDTDQKWQNALRNYINNLNVFVSK